MAEVTISDISDISDKLDKSQIELIQTMVMDNINSMEWRKFLTTIINTNPIFSKYLYNVLKYLVDADNTYRKIYNKDGIYPPIPKIFAAFNAIPDPSQVRVIILGQDPYHQRGQAMGLSFSVPDGVKIPPSLANIYRELQQDPDVPTFTNIPNSGDLSNWANQGVLLLNSSLTVQDSMSNSHASKWRPITDHIIRELAASYPKIVFMLWGGNARNKKKLINSYVEQQGHLILEAAHPSPLAANKGGWFGTQHFSKANAYLIENGYKPIVW